MKTFTTALVLSTSLFLIALSARAQQSAPVPRATPTPAAVTSDPPIDTAHPAGFAELTVPSHGSKMNGIFYLAAGAGNHPTVVLFHGFPGNEQNLDLAQSIRRAGWNVLYFHYRGSWSSPGSFTFSNAIADAQASLDWLHEKDVAAKYHVDTSEILIIGHSMGGAIVSYVGAHDPRIAGVVMISAVNLGNMSQEFNNDRAKIAADMAPDLPPLGGVTADTLIDDIAAHRAELDDVTYAPLLKDRPVLVITSDDGLAPDGNAFVDALKKAGSSKVSAIHLATDHSYSAQRLALQSIILNWIHDSLPTPSTP